MRQSTSRSPTSAQLIAVGWITSISYSDVSYGPPTNGSNRLSQPSSPASDTAASPGNASETPKGSMNASNTSLKWGDEQGTPSTASMSPPGRSPKQSPIWMRKAPSCPPSTISPVTSSLVVSS